MSEHITAIYENGVFRPLQLVNLNDHTVVSLAIFNQCSTSQSDAELVSKQREAIKRMLDATAAISDDGPDDGLSNRDHDFVVYGWKK
ncbi:MAG TPA: antitoxin family protein [Pirellulales bacterium]|jgi:predicted DNA-binding antitoxin AbrB/MazE fold protein